MGWEGGSREGNEEGTEGRREGGREGGREGRSGKALQATHMMVLLWPSRAEGKAWATLGLRSRSALRVSGSAKATPSPVCIPPSRE